MSRSLLLAAGGLLFSLNCAHIVMTPPQASMENTQRLRASNAAPVQLGAFTLDAWLAKEDDQSMSMRGGNSLTSPVEASFTQYLKATLAEELKAAGLLDPKADVVITGSLVASELHTGIGTATGQLKAHFTVTRAGSVRYDRDLTAADSWDSSFMAAVAVPAAANHYQGLFRKMVGALIEDKDFQGAVAK